MTTLYVLVYNEKKEIVLLGLLVFVTSFWLLCQKNRLLHEVAQSCGMLDAG